MAGEEARGDTRGEGTRGREDSAREKEKECEGDDGHGRDTRVVRG